MGTKPCLHSYWQKLHLKQFQKNCGNIPLSDDTQNGRTRDPASFFWTGHYITEP